MSSQQVSQFISTYGLPPPPNKFSPRKSKFQNMEGVTYNPPGSGMATPRGMRIGRRQESLGPDIEGGEFDDNYELSPSSLTSSSSQNNENSRSHVNSKQGKKLKRKELNKIVEDDIDPDLKIVSSFFLSFLQSLISIIVRFRLKNL